jgi:outer membrane protein assembly factor BamE (lipoprotein component of BamABCDE complex)
MNNPVFLRKFIVRTLLVAVATCAFTAACSPNISTHGNVPNGEIIKSIRVGMSNRDQVAAMLGTPSAVATFNKEAWYYVGSSISRVAFWKPDVLERRVLVIRFDKEGVVQKIEHLDKMDGREVKIVGRTTPTRGKELTILDQLLGNIGKFSGANTDP